MCENRQRQVPRLDAPLRLVISSDGDAVVSIMHSTVGERGGGNKKRERLPRVRSSVRRSSCFSVTASQGFVRRIVVSWRRLTLPHRFQCSTISAHRLNDRVRDVTGCTPVALATNIALLLSRPCYPATLPTPTTSNFLQALRRLSLLFLFYSTAVFSESTLLLILSRARPEILLISTGHIDPSQVFDH